MKNIKTGKEGHKFNVQRFPQNQVKFYENYTPPNDKFISKKTPISSKCNKHKDELEVGLHYHHINPVINNPVESADIDNCITFCESCYKGVHQNVDRCGYGGLRRC